MMWPVAELDNIRRARVLAASVPSAAIQEVAVDLPFDEFWAWMTDFERTTPLIDSAIRKVTVRRRDADRVDMLVWGRWSPIPLPIRATLEDGFCIMRGRARLFLVVMAAVPEGDGTRYAHVEGVPLPGTRLVQRLIRRMVAGDVRGIEEHAPRRGAHE